MCVLPHASRSSFAFYSCLINFVSNSEASNEKGVGGVAKLSNVSPFVKYSYAVSL